MSGFDTSIIEQLIEDFPFESSTVEKLEDFLLVQCKTQTYHFEANKALMKNYQVHTKIVKPDMITRILVLALMQMPASDYLALTYMVPVAVATSAPSIKYLAAFSNFLERGQYKEFWVDYSNAPSDLFMDISGVADSFRRFILHSLRDAFKNIPLSLFQDFMGIGSSEDAAKLVSQFASVCEIVSDKVVFISGLILTKQQPKSKVDDTLKVDEVLRIVDSIRAVDRNN